MCFVIPLPTFTIQKRREQKYLIFDHSTTLNTTICIYSFGNEVVDTTQQPGNEVDDVDLYSVDTRLRTFERSAHGHTYIFYETVHHIIKRVNT